MKFEKALPLVVAAVASPGTGRHLADLSDRLTLWAMARHNGSAGGREPAGRFAGGNRRRSRPGEHALGGIPSSKNLKGLSLREWRCRRQARCRRSFRPPGRDGGDDDKNNNNDDGSRHLE
jgi:hypothetical protein